MFFTFQFHEALHFAILRKAFLLLFVCFVIAIFFRGELTSSADTVASASWLSEPMEARIQGGAWGSSSPPPSFPYWSPRQLTFALQFNPSKAFQKQLRVMLSTQKNCESYVCERFSLRPPPVRASWLCLAQH